MRLIKKGLTGATYAIDAAGIAAGGAVLIYGFYVEVLGKVIVIVGDGVQKAGTTVIAGAVGLGGDLRDRINKEKEEATVAQCNS